MPGRFVPILHGAIVDRPDEQDTVQVAAAVAAALGRLGYRTGHVTVDLDLSCLAALAEQAPHAVFNMVEAIHGKSALSHMVPAVLDHLGIPFTGAGADAYLVTLSKLLTKQALAAQGIATPGWWIDGSAVPAEATVIIKSVWEHASWGMDTASVVAGSEAGRQIREREARFGGTFFAESFVDGREFNIAILDGIDGPEIMPIPEILFDRLPESRPNIVDFEAKWMADSHAYHNTPRRFGLEAREPALAQRLAGIARASWRCFGLAGYARVDIRTDAAGEPFVLEVNANPCLALDAGFMATAQRAGLGFDAVIGRIVEAALRGARLAA